MAKSSPDTADETTADPFAFVPDPVVLVSKRGRRFMVPGVLFDREATAAEREAWARPDARTDARSEMWIVVQPGVTFLGTFMTAWRDLLATNAGQASRFPDMSRAVLVLPGTQGLQRIADNPANKDNVTNRLRPDKVRAIFERVFAFLKDQQPDLWRSQDAFDAPEMMMIPLSEILDQRTPAGQQANAMVTSTIPVLRRNLQETVAPLGVLHDYAIRHRGGGAVAIAAACKAKAAKWQVGR